MLFAAGQQGGGAGGLDSDGEGPESDDETDEEEPRNDEVRLPAQRHRGSFSVSSVLTARLHRVTHLCWAGPAGHESVREFGDVRAGA